jgi:hypothetical protein
MLIRKTDPIGLDVLIDRLQVKLGKLSDVWGAPSFEITGFPRCYVNDKDGNKNIEYFDKDNEYSTVLYAENTKFFFTQESDITPIDTTGFKADVNLFFIIDLKEVKENNDRDDYKCLNDVITIIHDSGWFEINNIDTDFKSIFRNTAFIDNTDNLNPYYCFMVSLKSYRFETDLTKCGNE